MKKKSFSLVCFEKYAIFVPVIDGYCNWYLLTL